MKQLFLIGLVLAISDVLAEDFRDFIRRNPQITEGALVTELMLDPELSEELRIPKGPGMTYNIIDSSVLQNFNSALYDSLVKGFAADGRSFNEFLILYYPHGGRVVVAPITSDGSNKPRLGKRFFADLVLRKEFDTRLLPLIRIAKFRETANFGEIPLPPVPRKLLRDNPGNVVTEGPFGTCEILSRFSI